METRVGVMDFVEILPPEVVEEIFQHLSSESILSCSLVSLRWREALNSNIIWANICAKEGLHEKEYLVTDKSYFENPLKRFRPVKNLSDRLSDICYWRTHYDQYKFLESNWKRGRFATHQLDFPSFSGINFYNDGIFVFSDDFYFLISSIRGEVSENKIYLKDPSYPFGSAIIHKEYFIYTQCDTLIGCKCVDDSYKEIFCLTLPGVGEVSDEVFLVASGDYLVYNALLPPQFFIYNLKTEKLERKINVDNGCKRVVFNCIDAYNQKLYISLTLTNRETRYCILEYDIVKGELCAEYNVPHAVIKFFFADGIIGGQSSQNNNVLDILYLWSTVNNKLLTHVSVNGKQPIILTKDVVFFCQNSTVIMKSVTRNIDSKFIVKADTIVSMMTVGKSLLAINTGDSVEIWDWGNGEKLYTPYRGICSASMWVDSQKIIVHKWGGSFQVIGFW